MKLIPRLRFGIMGDISIVFFEWMVFQLFVLPFLLFSFVPAVYVFANDDQCDLFKPFHIRKAVHLQEIFITIKFIQSAFDNFSKIFCIEGEITIAFLTSIVPGFPEKTLEIQ